MQLATSVEAVSLAAGAHSDALQPQPPHADIAPMASLSPQQVRRAKSDSFLQLSRRRTRSPSQSTERANSADGVDSERVRHEHKESLLTRVSCGFDRTQ